VVFLYIPLLMWCLGHFIKHMHMKEVSMLPQYFLPVVPCTGAQQIMS